jgi:hypothetical protein
VITGWGIRQQHDDDGGNDGKQCASDEKTAAKIETFVKAEFDDDRVLGWFLLCHSYSYSHFLDYSTQVGVCE